MATITSFEDLEIWKKSRDLCQKVFNLLIQSPNCSQNIKNQIGHSSASVMAIRAFDRNFINENEFIDLKNDLTDLSKMISSFMTYLKNIDHNGNKFQRP